MSVYIQSNVNFFPFKQATGIQAAIRQHIHQHQRGGNLLKAEVRNGHEDDQGHAPVTFTGTRTDDERTGKLCKSVSYKLSLITENALIKITSSGQHFL